MENIIKAICKRIRKENLETNIEALELILEFQLRSYIEDKKDNQTGDIRFHVRDDELSELITNTMDIIDYRNERLEWSLEGTGVDAPEYIREDLSELVKIAKGCLSNY